MAESKALIYAELLHNIRQISVIAALNTPSGPRTKAELSTDRRQLLLHHEGETTSLSLPCQTGLTSQLESTVGKIELSWRLPLSGPYSRVDADQAQNIEIPWSAKVLVETTSFSCRACNTVVVKRGSIKTWKDLPSDNWAEMMEFWHCHKPDMEAEEDESGSSGRSAQDRKTPTATSHHDSENSLLNKGYGANTKFLPKPGTGFVDITTLLLSPSDCQGLRPTTATNRYQPICCSSCQDYIGHNDDQAEGYRLYKWRLRASSLLPSSQASASMRVPSTSCVLSTQFAAIIQSQLSSKLVVRSLNVVASDVNASAPFSSAPTDQSSLPSGSRETSSFTKLPERYLASKQGKALSSEPKPISGSSLLLWILQPSLRYASTGNPNEPVCSKFSTNGLVAPDGPILTPQSESFLTFDQLPLSISSPGAGTGAGQLAMKVFWKVISDDEAEKLGDKVGFEEVMLPGETISELEGDLRTSVDLLPESARRFQDWDVGLLERYEEVLLV